LIEPDESVPAAVFVPVRVDAKRDRDVGMTQDHHRVFRVHGKPLQQCGLQRQVTALLKQLDEER